MKKYTPFILFLIVVFFTACVEPFEPEIEKYENILVIDGLISNYPGPYTVKISRSFPYYEKVQEMVSKAFVKIIGSNGTEIILDEINNGIYQTDSNFQAQVGIEYKLHVETPDTMTYESEFEEIKNPIDIDSIYFLYEIKYSIADEENIAGVQIFLDTHDPNNDTKYYAWEYEETWKYSVPFYSDKFADKYYCFKSSKPKELLLGTSENLNRDEIKRHPITYVGGNTPKLRYKYSILIKQYSLSEKAYQYFKFLKSINESGGSLFDKTPTSIYGNIHNINDLNDPVLGLFQVSGISEKRFFIDRKDIGHNFYTETGFGYCKFQYTELSDSNATDSLLRFNYIIIDTNSLSEIINFTTDSSCFDCTQTGTNIVPDFWEE